MIVPVSSISGESYTSLFELFSKQENWISSFSNRPGKLFKGVGQRLLIFISRFSNKPALFTTQFFHWQEIFRDFLFDQICYVKSQKWKKTKLPLKICNRMLFSIYEKIINVGNEKKLALYEFPGKFSVWFHDSPTYWVRSLAFEPKGNLQSQRSNHYHKIKVKEQNDAFLISSIMNSSTYYLFFKMISNCRDLGKKEWEEFPLGRISTYEEKIIIDLGKKLSVILINTSLKKSRHYPSGIIEYNEYYPAKAKSIIDEIDNYLGSHYGFTAEEIDFIINYDYKFRMGTEKDDENLFN